MFYKHPGVYVQDIPSGLLSIEAASASTAVFLGPLPRGPVGEPVFITGVSAYAAQFGEVGGTAIRDLGNDPDYFGHAVTAFFDNGGSKAYIVRVGKTGALPVAAVGAVADPTNAARGLYMTAATPGTWGNRLAVTLEAIDTTNLDLGYILKVGTVKDGTVPVLLPLETFRPVFMDETSGRFVGAVVAKESALINAELKPIGTASGGGHLNAIRSGSLTGLVPSTTLKGKKIALTVNALPTVKIEFANPLTTITLTVAGGTAHTTPVSAAPGTPAALLVMLKAVIALESQLDGFNAYLDDDERLVLVPPPLGPTSTASVVPKPDADPDNTGLADLKLDGAARTALDHPAPSSGLVYFFNGGNGGNPGKDDYAAAFHTLRDYRDAAIIVLPGKTWTTATKDIVQTAIAHAEFMLNAMVIIDPPNQAIETPNQVATLAVDESPFAALYHPWLEVTNPHYDPDTAANRPSTFQVPPSAAMAGLWARIDATRGIWKAPAGLEASVRGTRGPVLLIGNDIQDNLNDLGVNCIRQITGPPVAWGARTLATRSKPEFRYIPVRRVQSVIGESLYRALQAVVFEPNDDFLWASLRASAGSFMNGLWRAGAFQGAKASDAYYVRCGLNSTMTQGDIDGGIVRVVVGFAPLKPAEFVVVQVQQIVGQTG